MMVPYEINMIVSSDPATGAINRSADGSRFEILLEDAVKVPPEAENITVSVEQATVWWVVPNILMGVNDKMYILAPNVANVLTNYTLTIPQGLYDLPGLNQAILRDLSNQGAKISPSAVIGLSPDDATGKVEMKLFYAGSQVDFTGLNTFREILGFDAAIVGPVVVAPTSYIAQSVAGFNTINYFLIHSDLVNRGIRFNNNYSQTISQVLIDVPPGSQITSTPFNPARTQAPELKGVMRTNLRFWLTDDRDRVVNTNGEYWSARLVIRYLVPFVLKTDAGRYIG